MSSVSSARARKIQEQETKKNFFELKKVRDEHNRKISKTLQSNKIQLERINKGHERRTRDLTARKESKLLVLRGKNEKEYIGEGKRLTKELSDIKQSHQEKLTELKITQENQPKDMTDNHKNSLDLARQRYMKEKLKWDNAVV